MTSLHARVLAPGSGGAGRALVLTAPISFWGGVDPVTGTITDVRHPQCGASVAGTVLFLPGTIGSSSASSVLLELVHRRAAPVGIVMHLPDAILLLGLLAAREMEWPAPVALQLDKALQPPFARRQTEVTADGLILCRDELQT